MQCQAQMGASSRAAVKDRNSAGSSGAGRPVLRRYLKGVAVRKPVSVLLVEDHALLRRELRRTLDDDPDLRVVGEAANGAEGVELAENLHPDVVVMDVSMPVMDGIQAARRMLAWNPEIAVLILSTNTQESCIKKAFDAGVRGYVIKDAAGLDLASAVKDAVAGKPVLPCAVPRF